MKTLMISVLCIMLCACGSPKKRTTGVESIVFGSKNKSDLSAVSDTAVRFYFSDDTELQSSDPKAFRLMNRMMQMQCEVTTAEEQWAWMQAVGDCISEYNIDLGRTTDDATQAQALKDAEMLIAPYSAGNQAKMNTWAYVMATLSNYRTISLYGWLIEAVKDVKTRGLLYDEYLSLYEIFGIFDRIITDYTYAEAYHSAAPMEINSIESMWTYDRYQTLSEEIRLLTDDDPPQRISFEIFDVFDDISLQTKDSDASNDIQRITVYSATEWAHVARMRCGEYFDFSGTMADDSNLPEAVERWIDIREKIADILPDVKRHAYMDITERMFYRLAEYSMNLRTVRS